MENTWTKSAQAPEDFFTANKDYPAILCQLFWNRGLRTKEQIEKFLNPTLAELLLPETMLNMSAGANRIIQAIKNNERMAIFGDYDTDGICSSVILAQFFNRINFDNFDVFIPNRFKSGYGLTTDKIKEIAEDGVKIIISVDCGITDVEEVELAKSLGLEVLIFDHHQPHLILPKTLIIDPNQSDDSYPFKFLVATAIAYKLVQLLARLMQFPYIGSLERQFLPLVAIATVADVAPLLDENRILVKFGLEGLKEISNIGLRALMSVAGISDLKKYDSYHIGFVIAPRLNAVGRVEHTTPAGRIEDTDYSFELLMTENENEAKVWAQKIHDFNIERQKQVEQILNDVNKEIEKQDGLERVIFCGSPNWSRGMIGVVAGRLKDKWHRPVLLYSQGETTSLGSARSIPGYNLVEVMDRGKELFLESGGHKEAAGFEFVNANLEKLHQFLKEQGDLLLREENLLPSLEIETTIEPEEITSEFLNWWHKFEPFGRGNVNPILEMKNVAVDNLKTVGVSGRHLKFSVKKNGKVFNVISFNNAEKLSFLKPGMMIDMVFNLKENEWQGRTYLDLELLDVKKIN